MLFSSVKSDREFGGSVRQLLLFRSSRAPNPVSLLHIRQSWMRRFLAGSVSACLNPVLLGEVAAVWESIWWTVQQRAPERRPPFAVVLRLKKTPEPPITMPAYSLPFRAALKGSRTTYLHMQSWRRGYLSMFGINVLRGSHHYGPAL